MSFTFQVLLFFFSTVHLAQLIKHDVAHKNLMIVRSPCLIGSKFVRNTYFWILLPSIIRPHGFSPVVRNKHRTRTVITKVGHIVCHIFQVRMQYFLVIYHFTKKQFLVVSHRFRNHQVLRAFFQKIATRRKRQSYKDVYIIYVLFHFPILTLEC